MLIRHATTDSGGDGSACAAIYAPYIADGVASLEETAPDAEEMAGRIAEYSLRHPWLVAESDGEVIGYAYGSEHRARAAYRWAVETTLYVSASHHRRGIGRALYGALLPLLVQQGMYVALAGITLPNQASVGLHEHFGYRPLGVYRGIGFKFGQWQDVGWWQAQLREQTPGETPPEPGPPVRLEDP